MKEAAVGFRMHSGWGIAVAVCASGAALQVIDRRRVTVLDATIAGSKQPYHFAAQLAPAKAEAYLATCRAASTRLAVAAVKEMVEELRLRGYELTAAAVLLGSGRELPSLNRILASHALIHTAEGEFYRGVMRAACASHGIPVTGMVERELPSVAGLGRPLGPPWTADHKAAATAAAILLGAILLGAILLAPRRAAR